jgi:hypothetical protein
MLRTRPRGDNPTPNRPFGIRLGTGSELLPHTSSLKKASADGILFFRQPKNLEI